MKIAVIVSQFNKKISDGLLASALHELKIAGIQQKNITAFQVPGAFEIPLMAATLASSKKYDGIITLGCVIKGETDHYEAVCAGVTYGLQKVSIEHRVPVMFGVLMCKNEKLARARTDKGAECAQGLLRLLNS